MGINGVKVTWKVLVVWGERMRKGGEREREREREGVGRKIAKDTRETTDNTTLSNIKVISHSLQLFKPTYIKCL